MGAAVADGDAHVAVAPEHVAGAGFGDGNALTCGAVLRCGTYMPIWRYAHVTKPEQSNEFGPSAPHS